MNFSSVRASLTIGPSWAAIAASIADSSREKVRGSAVWTTSTPWIIPWSISGTPRNEWKASSPASRKYLKRGCLVASSTKIGRSSSATSPASPSFRPIRTCPTLSGRRPTVAASTRFARSGSIR